MADAPWTPGPWKAEPADMFGDHNITLADTAEDCRAVAAVVSNLRNPDEVAANARLIAAAPAMAEALARLNEKWSSDQWVMDQDEMHDIVRAALSKARGEDRGRRNIDGGEG